MHEPKPYRWGDPMPRNARAVKDRRIRLRGRVMEAKLIRLGFDPVTFAFSGEDAEAGFAGLYELGLLSEPVTLNASHSIQVDANSRISGFGPLDRDLMDEGAINLQPTKSAPTAEQRASAMDFAGCFAQYVRNGAVIEGASALADRLAASKEFELAATLVFRNGQLSAEAPLASWADLIKAIDAVAAWLKTGELPADPSVLAQVFPPAAEPSVEDEILRTAGFTPKPPDDEDPEAPISEVMHPKNPPGTPAAGAQVTRASTGLTLADLVQHGLIRLKESASSQGLRTDRDRSTEKPPVPLDGAQV